MESKEKIKKWIDAVKVLESNPLAQVRCPECGVGYLKIKDEVAEKYGKLDRYMICDNCGRWNVMTMEIPENYFDTNKENKE